MSFSPKFGALEIITLKSCSASYHSSWFSCDSSSPFASEAALFEIVPSVPAALSSLDGSRGSGSGAGGELCSLFV